MIWLDIPVDECIGNLRRRGLRRAGSGADFDALLAWAADPHRQTSSSRVGHEVLYLQFTGEKHRLLSKEEINRFLIEFDGRRAR
ncbi:MAG TPA: hypothetical protein VE224_16490 [Pseudolabrys sp.]|nr:hypothetical protein [Pseudolabrys sp.]